MFVASAHPSDGPLTDARRFSSIEWELVPKHGSPTCGVVLISYTENPDQYPINPAEEWVRPKPLADCIAFPCPRRRPASAKPAPIASSA